MSGTVQEIGQDYNRAEELRAYERNRSRSGLKKASSKSTIQKKIAEVGRDLISREENLKIWRKWFDLSTIRFYPILICSMRQPPTPVAEVTLVISLVSSVV